MKKTKKDKALNGFYRRITAVLNGIEKANYEKEFPGERSFNAVLKVAKNVWFS
jgi:hypothetical protein